MFTRSRLMVLTAFVGAFLAAAVVIAGGQFPAVLETWRDFPFTLMVVVPAAMLGLALTGPAARAGAFDLSPWPGGFRLVVAAAVGLGVVALGTLGLGTAGLLNPPWVCAGLLMAAAGLGFLETRRFVWEWGGAFLRREARRGEWLLVLGAIPAAVLAIGATFPPGTLWRTELRGYDVLEYHLEVPREYAEAGSTAILPHNVYSAFPENVEMLYLLTGQVVNAVTGAGSALAGLYASQFLHALMMVLAAAGLVLAPTPALRGGLARVVAGVVFLAIPWTVVTGSLAYNEGGMLLDGGLALVMAMGVTGALRTRAWRHVWVLMAVLLGLAMGCKLTAGVFFAVPVALVMVAGGGWRRVRTVVLVAGIAAVVYGPWALRAAVYSGGNPVFPVAARWLPHRGWDASLAERFDAGHGAPVGQRSLGARMGALVEESVLDAQWSQGLASGEAWAAAWAGRTVAEVDQAAWWKRVGVLWVLVGASGIAGLRRGPSRRSVGVLIGVLAVQVGAWMFFTHLQGRFLLPAAVPLAMVTGIGLARAGAGLRRAGGVLVGVQAVAAGMLLLPEAGLLLGVHGRAEPSAAGAIGQLYERRLDLNYLVYGDHVPAEAEGGKVLLVGTATPLFLRTPAVYATAFDVQPLGEVLRAGGVAGAVAWMRREGIRYVWIDLEEIARLEKSYGFDPAITPALPEELVRGGLKMLPLDVPGNVRVLMVPGESGAGTSSGRAGG